MPKVCDCCGSETMELRNIGIELWDTDTNKVFIDKAYHVCPNCYNWFANGRMFRDK